MPSILRLFAAAALGILSTSAAIADWHTEVEEDLFSDGKKATMVGMMDASHFLFIRCTNQSDLEIAFIEKGEWEEGMSLVPLELVVRVDENDRHTSKGAFYKHNADFYGLRFESLEDKWLLVKQIAEARRQIQIGVLIRVSDQKWSGSMSASGSTKSARRLMEACNVE